MWSWAAAGRYSDEGHEGRKKKGYNWVLELAANNDVRGLKAAVEEEGPDVMKECGWWYCRQLAHVASGSNKNKMGLVDRSPIMIAALFGSLEVLKYILAVHARSDPNHINRVCNADKSTVLHCAMASGASNTSQMVHLLLSHGADPSHLESQGLCYLDFQAAPPAKALLTTVTPALEADGSFDWRDILMANVDETNWGCQDAGDYQLSPSQTSSPKSEKVSKHKTLQDHACDVLSSDILKNSTYTTDEFRMYSFKVRPCSRAFSHDWTECPFVHPGENARRRDPRRFHYSCVPCPDFRKGACRHGDACEYAHGVFESWLHPAQYRTRLCKDGLSCTRKVCFFAHTKEEVRPLFLATECGDTSPRLMSPADVASASSSGGAASPSAALRLVSFPPLVTNFGHSSLVSSHKGSCDTWAQPNLPTLRPPEGTQAGRSSASFSARDMSMNTLPDVDGQLIWERASLSGFNAAVAAPSCNGKHKNLMPANVELDVSPRSPLQMGFQFSPRRASKLQETDLEEFAPRRNCNHDLHHLKQMREGPQSLGGACEEHAGWGCPTGKPEWGVNGHDLTRFRSFLHAHHQHHHHLLRSS